MTGSGEAPNMNHLLRRTRQRAQEHWAVMKYDIMARGYAIYKEVSALYREAASIQDYEAAMRRIDAIRDSIPYSFKGLRTSIEHMWGYVTRHVQEDEREHYVHLVETALAAWQADQKEEHAFQIAVPLLLYLKQLAATYRVGYLQRTFAYSFENLLTVE